MRVVLLAVRRDDRCRSSDRWEAGVLIGVLLISVAAVPLAIVTGITAMDRSLATIHQQMTDRHRTVATVMSTARGADVPYPTLASVELRFQDSEGRWLKGTEKVVGTPSVGSHLHV
ncbi:MAG TPA: hypothetical protein VN108_10920, partial [Marmoricola sp.]|nr:hypothetical protein [Marmoricola sp.]